MERASILFACAVILSVLSRVEVGHGFVPASLGHSLRGNAGGSAAEQAPRGSLPSAWQSGLQTASTLLALSACAMAARGARRGRTQMQAVNPYAPTLVYMTALQEAASKQGEAVQVSKDVMKVKDLYNSDDFLEELGMTTHEFGVPELEKVSALLESIGDLESTVFPKFLNYLAKKKRLGSVLAICEEYVKDLYDTNGVVPVVVTSADPLSMAQKEALKEKMKVKTGATDIKLVCKVSSALIGGFEVEWQFGDPQNLSTPSRGENLSLKSLLEKAAINQGVSATVSMG